MAQISFNPSAAPEQRSGFSPLPAGNYVGQIVESDIKRTKTDDGEYVAVTIEVLSDGYRGRRVFHNINHKNQSEVAQSIGQGQLRFLCENAGVAHLTETSQLHNRPFGMALKVKDDAQYGAKNEVKGFMPATDVKETPRPSSPMGARPAAPMGARPAGIPPMSTPPAHQPAQSAPAGAPATSTGSALPPWAQKK